MSAEGSANKGGREGGRGKMSASGRAPASPPARGGAQAGRAGRAGGGVARGAPRGTVGTGPVTLAWPAVAGDGAVGARFPIDLRTRAPAARRVSRLLGVFQQFVSELPFLASPASHGSLDLSLHLFLTFTEAPPYGHQALHLSLL